MTKWEQEERVLIYELILSKINQMKKLLILLSVFTIACSEPNFPIEDIGLSEYVADSVIVPYASLTNWMGAIQYMDPNQEEQVNWNLLRNRMAENLSSSLSPSNGLVAAERYLNFFGIINRIGLIFDYVNIVPSGKKIDSIFLYLYVISFTPGAGFVVCDAPLLWCQDVDVDIWDEAYDYTFAASGGSTNISPYWKAYYHVIGYKSPITGTGYWRVRLDYLPSSIHYGAMWSGIGICEYAHDYVGSVPDDAYSVGFNLSSETNRPQLVIYYSDPPPSNTQKSTIIGVI